MKIFHFKLYFSVENSMSDHIVEVTVLKNNKLFILYLILH